MLVIAVACGVIGVLAIVTAEVLQTAGLRPGETVGWLVLPAVFLPALALALWALGAMLRGYSAVLPRYRTRVQRVVLGTLSILVFVVLGIAVALLAAVLLVLALGWGA